MSTTPRVEPGWNPYRWVEVTREVPRREPPTYLHRFEGLSGRFECTLEALTPLFIGDGRGRFFGLAGPRREPIIPGTSLKGAIRALSEVDGHAAVSFPTSEVASAHRKVQSSEGAGAELEIDPAACNVGHRAQGGDSTTLARAEWQHGNAISQAGDPGFGICADIACVCANLLPSRLRARGRSVRDHRPDLDQMHAHRLRRGFSNAVRRVL